MEATGSPVLEDEHADWQRIPYTTDCQVIKFWCKRKKKKQQANKLVPEYKHYSSIPVWSTYGR